MWGVEYYLLGAVALVMIATAYFWIRRTHRNLLTQNDHLPSPGPGDHSALLLEMPPPNGASVALSPPPPVRGMEPDIDPTSTPIKEVANVDSGRSSIAVQIGEDTTESGQTGSASAASSREEDAKSITCKRVEQAPAVSATDLGFAEGESGDSEKPVRNQEEARVSHTSLPAWPPKPTPDNRLDIHSVTTLPSQVSTPDIEINTEDTLEPLIESVNGAAGSPPVYRPPSLRPPKPRSPGTKYSGTRVQPLEVRINAQLDRHGFCTFRLLAQRPAGFPEELHVGRESTMVAFFEWNEEWYEVEPAGDLSEWLGGVLLTSKLKSQSGSSSAWQLSSRDVHILAAQQGFAGSTSTPRLCLGRKHLVLCRSSRAGEVDRVLAACGCGNISPWGEEMGAPGDWVFFWPVEPTQSVAPVPGDEILNILRPQTELELVLEGGVCLLASVWLAGHPPLIRVIGGIGQPVLIDSQPAVRDTEGFYTVSGCFEPGPHMVWCEGKSRSYSIEEPNCSWESWEAHSFVGGTICGALSARVHDARDSPLTLSLRNPVLVGALPGQIIQLPAGPGAEWTGFLPFQAVWALPDDPLHCNQGSSRVVLVNSIEPQFGNVDERQLFGGTRESRWCQAIQDCRRKRLKVVPDEATGLWRAYNLLARDLSRRFKQHGC